MAPAASRLTKEKRLSAELPSFSFDPFSRSFNVPSNDHRSVSFSVAWYFLRFIDNDVQKRSLSDCQAALFPAEVQGASPITDDIVQIFIDLSRTPRSRFSQGRFYQRRLPFINFFFFSLFSPRALEPSIDRELISMLLRIVFSTTERSSCGRRAPPQFFRPPRRTADIVVHISARGVSTIFLFSFTVTYFLCPLPIA